MKKNKKSIYREILALLVISILLPLLIVTGSSYYTINLSINDGFKNVAEANLKSVVSMVQDIHKEGTATVEMLSQDSNAMNIATNKDSSKWIKGTFDSVIKSHGEISNVYLTTIDKNLIISPSRKLPSGFDPTQRDWYKKAMEKPDKVILTDPYKSADDENQYYVTFAKTIRSVSGEIVGVIGMDIKVQRISEDVQNVKIGDNGYAILLDKKGTMIANKNTNKIGKNAKNDEAIKEVFMNKKTKYEQLVDKKKYVVFKRVEPITGYTVATFIPKEELTNDLKNTALFYFVVAVAALTIAIVLSSKFVKVKINKPINKIVYTLQELSKGNFTVIVEKEKGITQELEYIADAINDTRNGVVNIIKSIVEASQELKDNAKLLLSVTEQSNVVGEEVAKAVQQIADGSVHQSEKLNESVKLSEELGDKIEDSLKDSEDMLRSTLQVKDVSEEGTKLIKNLDEVFKESYNANLDVVEKVKVLEEKSKEIVSFTDIIKDITEQTNLLALNASIEAARAGVAGRGFTVVAQEVKNLAEQSANSAEQIGEIITQITTSISEVFERLKYSVELSEKTGESVKNTNANFNKIEKSVDTLKDSLHNVSNTLNKIKEDKNSVIVNISEASAVSQEAAATTEEVSASSEEQASGLGEIVSTSEKLNSLAEELEIIVSSFRVE